MDNPILLKHSLQSKPHPIDNPTAWTCGPRGYIAFGGVQIGGNAAALAGLLRALADDLAEDPTAPAPNIQRSAWDRVLSMTPQDVVEYFRQSPVLRGWANLVESAPAIKEAIEASQGATGEARTDVRVSNDLERVKSSLSGSQPSQADIAEVLFGERTKTGGSYRRRILAVLDALKTTTTTHKTGKNNTTTPKKAA